MVAWAWLARGGGQLVEHTRRLRPVVRDGVPHWLWTTEKPVDDDVNAWFVLDGQSWPPLTRMGLGWDEDASRPVAAEDLVHIAARVTAPTAALDELGPEVGLLVQQGATALSRGFLDKNLDRTTAQIAGFRILQVWPQPVVATSSIGSSRTARRGLARPCPTCGHPPGMHKCCPRCSSTADGEPEIERAFGFRTMRDADGNPYEVPQPWCRSCRAQHEAQPQVSAP